MAKTRREVELSEQDARLRAESPAYAPDDAWQLNAPQGMSVVVSVRLDPESARKLASRARVERISPSALLRRWTTERLGDADLVSPERAIGESVPAYDVLDDYEAARQRYRPERIKVLMVGESRPAGGTFFYLANSHLFFATREAFVRARGPAPSGSDFLRTLQDEGVWLFDLAETPVNQLPGRPRRVAVAARTGALVTLLRDAAPDTVVAIKRSLEPTVRAAMDAAGIGVDRLVGLPFPLYQWREAYVAGLAEVFAGGRTPGSDHWLASAAPSQASSAIPDAMTQPVTPNDLSSGQIRVPKASKPILPSARARLAVDLRGHRLETTYDPRNGPDRARSGILRIPRDLLRRSVRPYERLRISAQSGVVLLA